jgi:hypothetical protein
MKRTMRVCEAGFAMTILGFVVYFCLVPVDPISRDNFKCIRVGMSKSEVEQVLGCPPDNCTSCDCFVIEYSDDNIIIGDHSVFRFLGSKYSIISRAGIDSWTGNSYFILVRYGEDGKVTAAIGTKARSKSTTWYDKLLW